MPRSSKTGVLGLHKNAAGRYEVDLRWTDPETGRRLRKTTLLPPGATLAAAKERARRLLNGALAGTYRPSDDDRPRLRAALDDYLTWRKTNQRAGADASKRQAGYLVATLGDVQLSAIHPEDVERYKAGRIAKVKAATVNRELALFKHFTRRACQRGWLDEAQAERIRRVPLLKEPPGRTRSLSADEETRLMSALARAVELRAVVEAALLTGMRQGELLGLRVEQVNLAGREIVLTKTKANRSRRIPIAEALVAELESCLERSRTGDVFENRRGQPFTRHALHAAFRRAVARAKLRDLRFHDLRHSCATALRRAGADLDVIRRILGHSTLAMTLRYAHVSDELMRAAVGALPALPHPEDSHVAGPMPEGRKLRLVKSR
jgi:integrase